MSGIYGVSVEVIYAAGSAEEGDEIDAGISFPSTAATAVLDTAAEPSTYSYTNGMLTDSRRLSQEMVMNIIKSRTGRGALAEVTSFVFTQWVDMTLGIIQVQIFPSGAEKVQVQGSFTLGAASDNINPPGETVALAIIRSDSAQAYPTSYSTIVNGFDLTADGWSLNSNARSQSGVQAFNIKRTSDPLVFTFNITDTRAMVSQADYSSVTVWLVIGDDAGQTIATLRQQSSGNWIHQ